MSTMLRLFLASALNYFRALCARFFYKQNITEDGRGALKRVGGETAVEIPRNEPNLNRQIQLSQISCIFPHALAVSATMYTHDGESFLLSNRAPDTPHRGGVPSMSSASLHWERVRGNAIDTDGSLLQIGDCVPLPSGYLSVEDVIAVDGLVVGEQQHVAILMKGRMPHCAATRRGSDKRYFCVFATTTRNTVQVHQAVEMREVLAPDQVPLRVLYVRPFVAVVSGSSGLLGVASLTAAQRDPVFRLLVEDSQAEPVSHACDAAVTVTCYSSEAQILFSGDTSGAVCAWKIDESTGTAHLTTAPVSLGSKICYLNASPCGTIVAAALFNRLLILRCEASSSPTELFAHTLSVRKCVHRSTGNTPVKYAVAFVLPQQRMRVWCVGNLSDEQCGAVTWMQFCDGRKQKQLRRCEKKSILQEYVPVQPRPPDVDNDIPCAQKARLAKTAHLRENTAKFTKLMVGVFGHDHSAAFQKAKTFLALYCVCRSAPYPDMLAAALQCPTAFVTDLLQSELRDMFSMMFGKIHLKGPFVGLQKWLCINHLHRIGQEFWIDAASGHNRLCALHLRQCTKHLQPSWGMYMTVYGPVHLRKSSRGLRQLTSDIHKIDSNSGINQYLPRQFGYIAGLREIFLSGAGIGGSIPHEIGQLSQLRTVSLSNNCLSGEIPTSLSQLKHLQRFIVQCNNLHGTIPAFFSTMGCAVSVADNPLMEHGPDVPLIEREALSELFTATNGYKWKNMLNWHTTVPVAKWHRVGVMSSHVCCIVISANNMHGQLPGEALGKLTHLRILELSQMQQIGGSIPNEICSLTSLYRLSLVHCGLTGDIPSELGNLVGLVELQLFGNKLTGKIPTSIGNLTNLTLLSFGEHTGGNSFDPAPIPDCLSSLVNLRSLFMAYCNLTRSIPSWIDSFRDLARLDLQGNMLTGQVPQCIGRLQNLKYLNLQNNFLSGRLPTAELCTLPKLYGLVIRNCLFTDVNGDSNIIRERLPDCYVG